MMGYYKLIFIYCKAKLLQKIRLSRHDGLITIEKTHTDAIVWQDKLGRKHNANGPAVIAIDGSRAWYISGELHREDGPAIEYVDYNKWYKNGLLHRLYGPAVVYIGDKDSRYVGGKDCQYVWGLYREWWVDGRRHRIDGPAIEYTSGTKCWYVNGRLHREDGPANERYNGDREWFINGQLHREDGPAMEHADGTKIWFLKSVLLSSSEHTKVINKTISLSDIDNEDNIEKRRLFIETYGFEKYLKDSNVATISSDEIGVLYRKDLPDDEPIVIVKVKNSTPEPDGSYKDYFIRVPPRFGDGKHKPKDAIAWTFDIPSDEYSLLQET